MATFAGIHAVNASDALVGGEVRWGDLLQRTLPLELTPPRSPISSISAWGGRWPWGASAARRFVGGHRSTTSSRCRSSPGAARSSRARAGNDPTCFMPSVPDSASLASSSGRGCV
jgi:hypothetical protein